MGTTTEHQIEFIPSETFNLLKAITHEIRYEILSILAHREACVCDLEAFLGLNQSKVSYHLGILKDAGLVKSEQRGKNSYYQLVKSPLYHLGGNLLEELMTRRLDTPLIDQNESMC
ncbi:ArsR/SmtB family transcription factor [Deinococcus cellulosilyticus]|uniref:HTH arsR-type domain-containing protein n=1 Tax=Deinococcus cellulosilyticus (strain DSM 18568 / NBRC 106333 / KACC 11606 / 5516J-15) TaxID=1223518 RepID=A0A511MYI0_DEIC1|nr:metalloregulator ArsR/SmtB family transcription factor [Deinococcus cellulosilyticus]GEM45650.1 hypothetical protein DC3_12850 [Deinococcus cellulosilyticus NBRC 106333 = KACC 11606]